MRAIQPLCLLATVWFLAPLASAHHAATGRYSPDDFGVVEGEITDIFWRNPHVRFLLSRTNDNGQQEQWEIEFGSVNTVERLGVSREVVAVGDHVSVYGRLGRDGLTAMFASSMTLASGEEVALQASEERRYGITESTRREAASSAAALRADIFRVWVPVERPDTGKGGIEYPFTAAGQATRATWDPEQDPALRCIPPGLPTAMDNPYPVQFIDRGNTIAMLLEEWDGERTIYMQGSGEPAQPRFGHSTGRWEDGALVVETRDIDWRYIDDLGSPQSEDVVIDERFSLSEDGTDLYWTARITDPVNYTAPVRMEMRWTWVPGNEIKPFDCALPDDRR